MLDVPIKRIRRNTWGTPSLLFTSYTYQNEDQEYQDIVTKLSKNLSELEYTIKYIRKYNKNIKNQLINNW